MLDGCVCAELGLFTTKSLWHNGRTYTNLIDSSHLYRIKTVYNKSPLTQEQIEMCFGTDSKSFGDFFGRALLKIKYNLQKMLVLKYYTHDKWSILVNKSAERLKWGKCQHFPTCILPQRTLKGLMIYIITSVSLSSSFYFLLSLFLSFSILLFSFFSLFLSVFPVLSLQVPLHMSLSSSSLLTLSHFYLIQDDQVFSTQNLKIFC